MLRKYSANAVLISLLTFSLLSCSKHSTLDQITATDASKHGLLAPRLDKFRKAVYWGNLSGAIEYVEENSRNAFGLIYTKRMATEDIVEVKIRKVDFVPENIDEAKVVIETQFYSKPSLYVNSRYEKQLWVYNRLDGGWLLRNAEIVDKSEIGKQEVEDEPKQLF